MKKSVLLGRNENEEDCPLIVNFHQLFILSEKARFSHISPYYSYYPGFWGFEAKIG